MLLRRFKLFPSSLSFRKYSQYAKESGATEQKDQTTTDKENKTQTNNNQDDFEYEEEPAPPKSIYWLWAKRTMFLCLGYLSLTTFYTIYRNNYNSEYSSYLLELEPFYSFGQKIYRGSSSAYFFLFNPPITKLLPPKIPLKPEVNKKTLVLNFEGTLYAKDFNMRNGTVIHLRPGFQKFLQNISNNYEILLYSEEDTSFMGEVISTIDPMNRHFPWYAGHEFMVWTPQGYRKDLKLVNRDIRKVVVVDLKRDVYADNFDNIVTLKKYNGEEEDESLKDLGIFLLHLSNSSVKDVRKEIQKYGGEDAVHNYSEKIKNIIHEQTNRRSFFSRPKKLI